MGLIFSLNLNTVAQLLDSLDFPPIVTEQYGLQINFIFFNIKKKHKQK